MNSAKDEIKNKIREKYKGNKNDVIVIPADKEETFLADDSEKRVAIYVRVSTDSVNQTSSFELQKNYYTDIVDRHKGWTLVDIYADEGTSGTSLNHRDSFLRMIEDCKKGNIDLIVTKSVSRFARNLEDCIHYIRELRSVSPSVAVYFEVENIYTLNEDTEMILAFTATLAQEESRNKSKSMNASIDMRFSRGILLTPVLLGYDHDEDGNLIINEAEANTVRLIFFLYLYGCSCEQIAQKLTELGRKTKTNNEIWSASTVSGILHNERHCGDVIARKTYTPNYLDHKSKKNNKNRNQYRYENHHEAIVSRDDFIAVQHMMLNAKYHSKYSNKSFLPELYTISDGILKGYVAIHPTWAGFTSDDYLNASKSVYAFDEFGRKEEKEYQANEGDFDFRGFEIARSQFFDNANKISVTFGIDGYIFSTAALRKLNSAEYVEILLNPITLKIAVRITSNKNNKYAIRWVSRKNGVLYPNKITGAAYIKTIYELFGWNKKYSNIDVANVTGQSELKENINNIINEIRGEVDNE